MVDRSRLHEGLEPADGSYPPDLTHEDEIERGLWITLYDQDMDLHSMPYVHDGKPITFPPLGVSHTITDAVVTDGDGHVLATVHMNGPHVVGAGDQFVLTVNNTWALQ